MKPRFYYIGIISRKSDFGLFAPLDEFGISRDTAKTSIEEAKRIAREQKKDCEVNGICATIELYAMEETEEGHSIGYTAQTVYKTHTAARH